MEWQTKEPIEFTHLKSDLRIVWAGSHLPGSFFWEPTCLFYPGTKKRASRWHQWQAAHWPVLLGSLEEAVKALTSVSSLNRAWRGEGCFSASVCQWEKRTRLLVCFKKCSLKYFQWLWKSDFSFHLGRQILFQQLTSFYYYYYQNVIVSAVLKFTL